MFTSKMSQLLPVVLLQVERNEVAADDDTADLQIETLAALAEVAYFNAKADGQFGGYGGIASVRSLNETAELDPSNDALMVPHIRQLLQVNAASLQRRSSGKSVASGIPYEDRGKTVRDASGLAESISMPGGSGPMVGAGPQQSIAQWGPILIWSLQTVGKIIQKRRERKAAQQ